MTDGSRIPGFYRLPLAERLALVAERSGVASAELEEALRRGGLDAEKADKLVENVLGTYALPFGVALNVRVNERDHLVPMVVEEPSVIAAASNAARMIRASGGFHAEVGEALMTAQVQIVNVRDPAEAVAHLVSAQPKLMELARAAVPNLLARGGGPREIEVRDLGSGMIVLHVYVDCRDAMGANLVNSIAEAIGPSAAELARGVLGLRILSNLCDRRLVRVRCRVHPRDLGLAAKPTHAHERPSLDPPSERPRVAASEPPPAPGQTWVDGGFVAERIVLASRFAELDPYRAATHNKGVMNGVDAVVLASGNDFRAVEAGAHAYAARSGRYAPLVVWRRDGEDLTGELEMPLALGTVGGTLRVHPVAQVALKLMRVTGADELAQVAASVGVASNLAALRALATEGIQRGHMSLHARSVAVAAGALGGEVELVALAIAEQGSITVEAASRALATLRVPAS
ncbi:MAG TPA: hydroxymethylglutaryl-CoA reductase [Polyangiaceae bacterium]|nr:hydroxymethylglutaryl-CoA reductase [Polyangiaceae bacterium]